MLPALETLAARTIAAGAYAPAVPAGSCNFDQSS